MFGYPQFYGKQEEDDQRIWQKHVFIYWVLTGIIFLIFIFENQFVYIWRVVSTAVIHCWGRQVARWRGVEYDTTDYSRSGTVLSDDLYYDINFDSLVKLYKQTKKDKTRYKA